MVTLHYRTIVKAFLARSARFRRRYTHVPNLTDELSTANERRLSQFDTAVLVRYGKSSTESVELLSNST